MPSKRRRKLHTEKMLLSHSISQFQAAAKNLSMNDSEFLITMARQISASLLYAFLSSIRESSRPSLHERLINGFHSALSLRMMSKSSQRMPSEEEWTELERLLPRISLVQVANMLSVLRKVFPSETRALEGVTREAAIVSEMYAKVDSGELDKKWLEFPLTEAVDRYKKLMGYL